MRRHSFLRSGQYRIDQVKGKYGGKGCAARAKHVRFCVFFGFELNMSRSRVGPCFAGWAASGHLVARKLLTQLEPEL